jgi:hypothetical protein
VIVPDVNLLIYAYDASSPFHAAAAALWQQCLSGEEPVGLAPVVLFGFVRVSTHPRVFLHPLTVVEAAAIVRSWLEQPVARVLEPSPGHLSEVLSLLEGVGTAGNLVTDAQIAALVMEHDAVLHTSDADFLRFPGLRWTNPLVNKPGKRLSRSGRG